MKLEVGKKYVSRGGHVTSPLEESSNEKFPFRGQAGNTHHIWREDGTWGIPRGYPSTFDLVSEFSPAEQSSPGRKADAGKPQFDLLMGGCPNALLDVVKVLTFAVTPEPEGKGYIPHSWKQVPEAERRYLSALHRHLNAAARGEANDPESGLPHWAHIVTNALFLAELHQKP